MTNEPQKEPLTMAGFTQAEFELAFAYVSRGWRLEEAAFWQDSAAQWFWLADKFRNEAPIDIIVRRMNYAADAHKIARLYAGTWE